VGDRIPPALRIGPTVLVVERAETLPDTEVGAYHDRDQKITVLSGMAPVVSWGTLFHEWYHGIEDRAGIEHDESTAERTAWAVVHLLLENPALQRLILEDLA
jgi:hypothetical protein